LKQIQNEKRRLLVETETEKLKSVDEGFRRKFEVWRNQLGPRKQVTRKLQFEISIKLIILQK